MSVEQGLAPAFMLLTDKQIEALDLLVEHRSTKEIAAILGISPSAVDQRIYSAADRLGEPDRRKLARKYAALKAACMKHTGEISQVPLCDEADQPVDRDLESRSVFLFNDVATYQEFAPWAEDDRAPFLEKLDALAGPIGRIAVIVGIAAMLAMLLLATFAIGRTLGDVI